MLPDSFRELYRLSDGSTEMDGHEQLFWPLSAITRTLDSFDAGDPDATWLGFADFRLQTAVLRSMTSFSAMPKTRCSGRTTRSAGRPPHGFDPPDDHAPAEHSQHRTGGRVDDFDDRCPRLVDP